jgi:glucose-6-phosphate dehydrogenase assembly protein OpcA
VTTLWDTTGAAVVRALAAARQSAGLTSGLALTLVVVAEERTVAEAEAAATTAAAAHPLRLLVVVRREIEAASPRLDAEVSVGGRLGPGEAVVMRMYGRLALHAESVVLPLLASDVPVVTWWHQEPPERICYDPLGVLAERRITDAAHAADPAACLHARAEDYAPGDTDLAWTRITPWRALLAGAFDTVTARATSGRVAAEPRSPSALLLAGWLRERLGVEVGVEETAGPGLTEAEIRLDDGTRVLVSRPDGEHATLHRAGLGDRTVALPRRDTGTSLAEELRRLDPDQPYAAALAAATGQTGLHERSPVRVHEWLDPTPSAPAPG